MQMYDSDSQSESNFKIGKVPEADQPHIKEIIQKGKKILPTYDDEALFGLYKRYYSVENIFINELNMIARRLKGDQENDEGRRRDDKWINVGRQIKTKVNKSKYNFLEDKDLLRRAQLYIKNKNIVPERERRPNFNNSQRKQNTGPRQNPKPRNEQYNNQPHHEQKPKQKYVEKPEDKKPENVQEHKPQTDNAKKVEPTPATKAQAPVVQTKIQTPKVEEKRTLTQQKPVTQVQKTQEAPNKEESVKQSQPAPKQRYVEAPSKPVEQKAVQKPQPIVQTPKPVSQPASKETQNVSASHSIPTVQNFDPVLAKSNFEQACSQNSFILKFIQPQNYPQRISYIRTEDGSMKNVQIRVTGTSTGSQKKL